MKELNKTLAMITQESTQPDGPEFKDSASEGITLEYKYLGRMLATTHYAA